MFCDGFSFTRSGTHPYLANRVGDLFVMHDGPRKRASDYRRAEIVVAGSPVDAVLDGIGELRRDRDELKRYALCVITPTMAICDATKEAYKSRGFRLLGTEPMMVARAEMAPKLSTDAHVYCVSDQTAANRVSEAAGTKLLRPGDFNEQPIVRLYAADLDSQPIGWVRSIQREPKLAWVAGMYIKPEFRRRGIAKALLSKMLEDDVRHGVEFSVLLASHTGAKLYPALGYEQIGMLHAFSPVAKDS